MLARHSIALAVVVASAILSACASDKPEQRAEPPPPPIRPVAHSSVHAVLLHHSELALTDDQVKTLEILDQELVRANEAIEANLKEALASRKAAADKKHGDTGPGAGPGSGAAGAGGGRGTDDMGGGGRGGMGGGMGGGRGMHGGRGGGRPHAGAVEDRPDPLEKARAQMDTNDARAFEDAEAQLAQAQKPRAEEIAGKYREQLYDWREAMRKQGGHEGR